MPLESIALGRTGKGSIGSLLIFFHSEIIKELPELEALMHAESTSVRLTDEQWEAWLAERPEYRERYVKLSPAKQAKERARIERLHVLAASSIAHDMAELVALAEQARVKGQEILDRYGPDEAAQILTAAGMKMPHEYDIDQSWGADTFEESISIVRKFVKAATKFESKLDTEIGFVLRRAARLRIPTDLSNTSNTPDRNSSSCRPERSPSVHMDAAADLLTAAREQREWRPFYQEASSDKEREAQIASHARRLSIYNADIGQSAIRIGNLLESLTNEVEAFTDRWPDESASRLAVCEAFADAGLPLPSNHVDLAGVGASYFHYAGGELLMWLPFLKLMMERLDGFAPPDTARNLEEWNNQGRVAG